MMDGIPVSRQRNQVFEAVASTGNQEIDIILGDRLRGFIQFEWG